MNIIEQVNVKEISTPFPNFQPNTLIMSEQVNDNNDEIQYRSNLLIKAFNKLIIDAGGLEAYLDTHINNYNAFTNTTSQNFVNVRDSINTNKAEINTRVDNEVKTVNNRIDTETRTLNTKIDLDRNTINTKVDKIKVDTDKKIDDVKIDVQAKHNALQSSKGDGLELKNTLLYLKSGGTNISVADLAGLGGGTGVRGSSNVAFGQAVIPSDWVLDSVTKLYAVTINHRLTTSTPLITYFDEVTGFNMFDVVKVIDANTVKVYNERPANTYISVINGSSKVELVQAIIDDENASTMRTYSSQKIKQLIDQQNAKIKLLEDRLIKLETPSTV